MLVFWSASSKELERGEKKEKYRWNPKKTLQTPVSVTSFSTIVGNHFQDTEHHWLSLPRHNHRRWAWQVHNCTILGSPTSGNYSWKQTLGKVAPSSTIPPLLRWQTLCFPLSSWEQSPSWVCSPQGSSHLLWCWPHGCCSPRAAAPKQCSRGRRAPPSPCASSSAWPAQGCCLQTPGARWTACAGTLQMAEMALWRSSSPQPHPVATGLPESFIKAARNTCSPEEQYILQAPLTPTPDSAIQQTGSLVWPRGLGKGQGGVSGTVSSQTAFVTRHKLKFHIQPRQAKTAHLFQQSHSKLRGFTNFPGKLSSQVLFQRYQDAELKPLTSDLFKIQCFQVPSQLSSNLPVYVASAAKLQKEQMAPAYHWDMKGCFHVLLVTKLISPGTLSVTNSHKVRTTRRGIWDSSQGSSFSIRTAICIAC